MDQAKQSYEKTIADLSHVCPLNMIASKRNNSLHLPLLSLIFFTQENEVVSKKLGTLNEEHVKLKGDLQRMKSRSRLSLASKAIEA